MDDENICRLADPELIIAPHDKGLPPSWEPALHGEEVLWIDRETCNKLKKLRYNKPCEICPIEIKKKCKVVTEELKKFKNDLEAQEKRVNKKIDPILKLYDQGKIKKKEIIEKLSEAFYSLDQDD